MNRNATVGTVMCIALAILVCTPYAANGGFGEVATGPCRCLPFSIQVNHTENLTWTLVNYYNFSIGFYINPASLSSTNATGPRPIVHYSELKGTIPANSSVNIDVNVTMPANASTHQNWTGIAQAVSYSNNTGGGTSILIGTAKYLQISSQPSTTTSTTTISTTTIAQVEYVPKGNGKTIMLLSGIGIIMAAIGIGLYARSKMKKKLEESV